jgi:hypothetical protein
MLERILYNNCVLVNQVQADRGELSRSMIEARFESQPALSGPDFQTPTRALFLRFT